jgi:hypothetical protein
MLLSERFPTHLEHNLLVLTRTGQVSLG